MRIEKSDLRGIFERLVKKLPDGSYKLDHAPVYGGYVIEKNEESGGISHPFGSTRRSASEMFMSIRMACEAIELIKYNQEIQKKNEDVL